MTFWHSLVSFKAHLAHLPSPVIVMLSPAARVRTVAAANNNTATPATNANDFFIFRSFWLGLRSSALADIKSTILNWQCSNELQAKITSNHRPIAAFHRRTSPLHRAATRVEFP